MDKRRIASLEKQIRQKTGKSESPPPGFIEWAKGICEKVDQEYRDDLLKKGYTLEQVNNTPVFIE